MCGSRNYGIDRGEGRGGKRVRGAVDAASNLALQHHARRRDVSLLWLHCSMHAALNIPEISRSYLILCIKS
jgi:hypothetical protein